eukprot:215040-Prorocentrum_lima.AAC.1
MQQFLGLLVNVAVDQPVHEHKVDPELELEVGLVVGPVHDVGLVHDVGPVHNGLNVLDEVHNLHPDPLSWSER